MIFPIEGCGGTKNVSIVVLEIFHENHAQFLEKLNVLRDHLFSIMKENLKEFSILQITLKQHSSSASTMVK